MKRRRVPSGLQNGRLTYLHHKVRDGYEDAKPQIQSYVWSSTENSARGAWYVNQANGIFNNNNKYNRMVGRAVAAPCVPSSFSERIWQAYEVCQKGKRSSKDCIAYYDMAAEDIPKLIEALWVGSYEPDVSVCFLVSRPKWREVFAAHFRDRIVHHWVVAELEPIMEARFRETGNASYNCRKGYGTDRAVKELAAGIRSVTDAYRKEAWIYRGDIVAFFMSIDKDVLWGLLEPFIKARYEGPFKDILLRTVRTLVFHRAETRCEIHTPPEQWKHIAPNKSRFRAAPNKGMDIGNLFTQIFANFMLSYLDEHIKEVFKGRRYCYVRFVDDFAIVSDDRAFLLKQIRDLRPWISDNLRLELHHDKHYYQKASHGVLFTGSYVKNGRVYPGNRTVGRFAERVHAFNKRLVDNTPPSEAELVHMESTLNSYLGLCKRRKSYKLRKQTLLQFGSAFYRYFYIAGHYERVRIRCKYRIK